MNNGNGTEVALAAEHKLEADDPNREIKARLQVAKLERARLAEEREAAEQKRMLQDELEREELGLQNDRAIAEAEAVFGPVGKRKIAVVQCELGVVIVKKPHHVLFRRFMDVGEFSTDECEKLVRPCLVYPDKAKFDEWVEHSPALLVDVANAVSDLAGAKAKQLSGKS